MYWMGREDEHTQLLKKNIGKREKKKNKEKEKKNG